MPHGPDFFPEEPRNSLDQAQFGRASPAFGARGASGLTCPAVLLRQGDRRELSRHGLNPPGRGFQEKCHHPPSRKQMSMRTEPRRRALAIAQPPEQTRATALEALMSPQLFTSSQAAAIYSMVAQHGATQQSLLPRPPLLRSKFRHAGEFDLGRASPRWLPVSTPEWIASLNHRSATEPRVARRTTAD